MSQNVLEHREFRFHNNPYDDSNWCKICGLYYCWHEECIGHETDERARRHQFKPKEAQP